MTPTKAAVASRQRTTTAPHKGDSQRRGSVLDYGVPQTRKRLVVLASRVGAIELLPPSLRSKLQRAPQGAP